MRPGYICVANAKEQLVGSRRKAVFTKLDFDVCVGVVDYDAPSFSQPRTPTLYEWREAIDSKPIVNDWTQRPHVDLSESEKGNKEGEQTQEDRNEHSWFRLAA